MLCLNGFSRRYSAVLRFAKFSILTSSLEVETFLCYLLSLLFFYPSGISHSFVSSTRWRKFLWVLLGGLLASRFARALSRERGIQLQFAADSFCMMTIPLFSCQGQRKNFFFSFLPRWWRWWRLFWQQSDICWTNTLLLRQICTFFCQNFPVFWCGSGGRGESLSWENNNINEHVSKCRGIFTKDNVTQPLQKNQTRLLWEMTTCNQAFMQLSFENTFIIQGIH